MTQTHASYVDTFIVVADDCPARSGTVPDARSGTPPIAVVHYEMLAGHPYRYTQDDVLFETHLRRKAMPAAVLKARRAELRREFFAKDQPCLRTSPLARTYGWGFHFDRDGKVALHALGSAEYDTLSRRASRVLKALRSRRE